MSGARSLDLRYRKLAKRRLSRPATVNAYRQRLARQVSMRQESGYV